MRLRSAGAPVLALAATLAACPLPAGAAGGDGQADLRFAPGPPRDPEFLKEVGEAIDGGVAWLRRTQRRDGSFQDPEHAGAAGYGGSFPFGYSALGVYTLRACGVPADDPGVVLGLQFLRRAWKAGSVVSSETYEVALALLALEAHYAPPGGKEGAPREIPAADLRWIQELSRRLVGAQDGSGGFRYGPARGGPWDLSNTQYAVLGLKAARRCGVEVEEAVFRRCLEHLLGTQERTGPAVTRRETAGTDGKGHGPTSRASGRDQARGWGYREVSPGGATGSMTTGGVSSLVICRGELLGSKRYPGSLDGRVVQAIRDGVAWLGHHFAVSGNPSGSGRPTPQWHYYYLYGLERAGVLAGVTWMAERDWYLEGARFLLREQGKDGSWDGRGAWGGARRGGMAGGAAAGDVLGTCFALLFLKKATFRVEGAVATEESDRSLDLSGAADLDEASFRAVFDTVHGRFARADEKGRALHAADYVRMGTRALGLLILGLEAAEEADRAASLDALRRVTGQTRGFDPAAPAEVRNAAVADWEEWYFSRRRGLVADVGAGRFRDGGESR